MPCAALALAIGPRWIGLAKLPARFTRWPLTRLPLFLWFSAHLQGLPHVAGQYCFVCIPRVSLLQWHPFSISSGPNNSHFTFHIKVRRSFVQRRDPLSWPCRFAHWLARAHRAWALARGPGGWQPLRPAMEGRPLQCGWLCLCSRPLTRNWWWWSVLAVTKAATLSSECKLRCHPSMR